MHIALYKYFLVVDNNYKRLTKMKYNETYQNWTLNKPESYVARSLDKVPVKELFVDLYTISFHKPNTCLYWT
jgi:hypothetical protein